MQVKMESTFVSQTVEPFFGETASNYVGSAVCAPVLCYDVARGRAAVHHR
jgi:hypothetical protein